ncbi:MAG TPA: nucleotidyltransferase family protein [Pyrinomonadaceae bacterium]|nr:nucleotidyltransferase family protein [Pyrinomonadaceae bacterium]
MNALGTAKREEIKKLAANYGAHNVRLFGSVARGEAHSDSDIDVLVDLEPDRSLFDLGGLLMELQDLLGCRVDVVTEHGLRPRIRERVLRDAVPLSEMTASDCSISWKQSSGSRNTLRRVAKSSRMMS